MKTLKTTAVSILAALSLAACGGGGGITVSVEVPETDVERAREAAGALYAAFTQDPSITRLRAAPAALREFRAADGESHSQRITVPGDPFGDVAEGPGNDAASPGRPEGAYDIADDDGFNALNRNGASASVFGAGPSQVEHEPGESGVFSTEGEWSGVGGTFYCAGACTSRYGYPTGDDWTFIPTDAGDRTAGGDVVWGWWIDTDDGEITGVTAFHHRGGLGNGDYSDILAGPGSATYAGDATGKYVLPDRDGAFTARVRLNATFGGGTLSGGITDFTEAGRDLGWSVALREVGVSHRDGGFDGRDGVTVWTRGGVPGPEMGGAWSVDLYGGDSVTVPTHALGSFLARHQGSRMIGAFGAEKTEESAE
ncbi:MAG: hypothetical protein OXD36_18150 [Rhodobacter sp.]|nr:hypothetical protein [Rhodobacter sp.]